MLEIVSDIALQSVMCVDVSHCYIRISLDNCWEVAIVFMCTLGRSENET